MRVPVSPAYERNPGGHPITGSGHSATFPTPDSVAVTAIGSPTRPLGGSSRRASVSPRATAGGVRPPPAPPPRRRPVPGPGILPHQKPALPPAKQEHGPPAVPPLAGRHDAG